MFQNPQTWWMKACFLLAASLFVSLHGCKRAKDETPAAIPRPVSVLTLTTTDPRVASELTGTVTPWKQQSMAFEVGGRTQFVIDEGTSVTGRFPDLSKVEKGEEDAYATQGTVLARLDPTRYELNLALAEADVSARQAQADATRIEIEQVLQEELASAKAELKRASEDFDRIQRLIEQDAGSQTEYYRTEADFKVQQARVNQITARINAKNAELKATMAQLRHAEETVEKAREDLKDCSLYSPFNAEVSQVNVTQGAYVQPGQSILTLIMMDPLMVDLAVSAETDRAIGYRQRVDVFPPGMDVPTHGIVWSKDTAADPATKTFNIRLLVRNYKVPMNLPAEPELQALPRIGNLWPIAKEDISDPSSMTGTEKSAIYYDEASGGHYVWHVENLGLAAKRVLNKTVLTLRKVPVEVGERVIPVVGLMYFRELTDTGGLNRWDIVASGVPEGVQDGDQVLFVRERWLFRPGDLVDVLLDKPGMGPGFYVPVESILTQNEKHWVFLADGKADSLVARKTPVNILNQSGENVRIQGDKIVENARIILHGAHYLIDGEPITIVETMGVGQ